MKDYFITDFLNPLFQKAFKEYFEELGVKIKNWDGLFDELNNSEKTAAYLRIDENQKVIGFILFEIDEMKNWFFTEKIGFIREFWVSNNFRDKGYGTELLKLAEDYFLKKEIFKTILTTDTVPDFYIKNGYIRDYSYYAKNRDDVFIKMLK